MSELLGEGMTAQGASAKVYRALRTLLCERCGGQVNEGELFTRWPLAEQFLRIMPRCRACVPFEFAERCETPGRSPLIEELLSQPGQPEQAEDAAAKASQQDVERNIEKRLGPALRWTRRPRK
ncbi:MAG TPA: hypothetical protein VGO91_20535 [Pyrinomonadaceae bacterium]|nr:hypothetical protein [Pyrinomonadaceae bacterium]